MLSRFKNALYGNSSGEDNSDGVDDQDDRIGRKIRSVLTRSSSFRDDLLGESSRNRADSDSPLSTSQPVGPKTAKSSTTNNNVNGTSHTFGSLHRGRSQMLRKSTSTIIEGVNSNRDSCQYSRNGVEPTISSVVNPGLGHRLNRRNQSVYSSASAGSTGSSGGTKVGKFRYTRPEFLQLRTDDEIIVSADHQIRPIILPRDVARLPWFSGYGECINAGKSLRNEDQAACHQDVAIRQSSLLQHSRPVSIKDQIPWTYFGMFDGHAGTAVAVAAAAQLHNIISEKLRHVADLLIALEFDQNYRSEQEEFAEDEFADCQGSPTTANGLKNGVKTNLSSSPASETEVKGEDERLTHAGQADQSKCCAENELNEQPDVGDVKKEQEKKSDSQQGAKPTSALPTCDKKPEACDNPQSKLTQICDEEDEGEKASQELMSSNKRATTAATQPEDSVASNERMRTQNEQHEQYESALQPSMIEIFCMIDICRNNVTVDSLITGALESAFWEMDAIIANDKHDYKMPGGCTAIVSLFILGKLYVCNAGDSRAIVYKNQRVIPMSFDFTPTSERQRILRLGLAHPELLGDEFTHLEFLRRPTRKDLGKQMLYRDAYMSGWSMKTITYDDLRYPLVWGEGKRSRVLATIGVTRGFGDHELRAQYGSILIKPFLTPEPEVKVLPLEWDDSLSPEDVLIMGTDGLWDVTANKEAAEVIKRSFDLFPEADDSRAKYRYIWAAQDLVIHSRGAASQWSNVWRTTDDRLASLDDISVFVVPLKPYRDEYLEWRKLRCEHSLGASRGPRLRSADDSFASAANSASNSAPTPS